MKIDMHVHTINSKDSDSRINFLIRKAKEKGLDGFAITDHDKITIKKIVEVGNFYLIPGCEIRTDMGEVIGYFVKDIPQTKKFSSVVEFLKKQNALVSIPHPFDKLRKESVKSEREILNVIDKIDFLELNARSLPVFINKTIKFAKIHKIKLIAGSDSHLVREIGNAYTEFEDLDNFKVKRIFVKKNYFSLVNLIETKLKKIISRL